MPYIIIFIIVVIIFLTTFYKRIKKSNLIKENNCIKFIQDIDYYFADLENAKQNYFDKNKEEYIKNKYKQAYDYFDNRKRTILHDSKVDDFYESYSTYQNFIKQWNQEYVSRQLIANKMFFDDIDGKSLDVQQRTAIITDEVNNLVLAGAGSGKTLTIAGKVKFLVEKLGVNPDTILLLSFTNKATDEMTERIHERLGINITALTFHKLGMSIIRNYDQKFDVSDILDSIISEYFKSVVINDKIQMENIIIFFSNYINIPQDLDNISNLGEYYERTKNIDYETIKGKINRETFIKTNVEKSKLDHQTIQGETVKSLEEVMIANFLFLHGVNYEYEKKYPFQSEDKYRKSYTPDFYLSDYDIYLEHFGINKDGRATWLSPVEEEKYLEGIQWKRKWHAKNKTTLIETYSYYNKDGRLLIELEKLLKSHNVTFVEADYEKIYNKIYASISDKHFKEFMKLISSFISLFKSDNYQFEDFKKLESKAALYDTAFSRDRALIFLKIVKPIFQFYEKKLKESNSIDFNDMINKATDIINGEEKIKPYSYIIVDEYQDISVSRFNLIKALKEKTNAKIICVGDDWQSIYRFAGSDISLFTSFERYLGYTEVLKIEQTYRNSCELVDVAENFITKNPNQLKKTLKSNKHCQSPVVIWVYSNNKCLALKNAIDNIVKDFGPTSEIALLGRTKYDLQQIFEKNGTDDENLSTDNDCWKVSYDKQNNRHKVIYKKFPNLNIWFLTVHKSKGLEAENVIIINTENKLLGFPNRISDDPLLSLVLTDCDAYPYAEERRLFYVAITRTKNFTYLLTPDKNESVFISDIIQSSAVTILGFRSCKAGLRCLWKRGSKPQGVFSVPLQPSGL